MRTVSSRQNPLVRAFRDAQADDEGRRLLLDGLHLVRAARGAGVILDSVAVTHRQFESNSEEGRFARELDRDGIDVIAVSEAVMSALSPLKSPSGIVALGSRRVVDLDAICAHPDALVIAAVDVQDPGNLGALLRAAEAGGGTGILACGASAHPFSWKALRGSMGSAFRLPTAIVRTPLQALKRAHRVNLRCIASVPRTGQPPDAINWKPRTIVFVGGEGSGLSDELISECDEAVTVPMQAPVESLNVAVAGALLVYEARRQRHGLGDG